MDNIERLQQWFFAQCDGDWEHCTGLTVCPLDNPGWIIKLEVKDTKFEGFTAPSWNDYADDNEWIAVNNDAQGFFVACGPLGLNKAIGVFLSIVEGMPVTDGSTDTTDSPSPP